MGFLSGILGGQKTKVPASGLYSQPQSYQNLYSNVSGNINSALPGINSGMFSPLGQTADETQGLNQIRQGFAPTQDSLNQDIGMFMNPYQQYVMDPVQRQAQSDFSILKQGQNQAGQLGSNRGLLGANDIEQTRLSTMGNLNKQGYDSALQNVLTQLIPQRQSDAAGLLGIGQFQRNLDTQNKQAPLQALQAQTGLLGGIPTDFGNAGAPASTVKTGGGLGGAISGISSIASLFSDRRLKENIIPMGEEKGIPVYEFNYIGQPERYIGPMAQDVEEIMPEAVGIENGYLTLNHEMLGVPMRSNGTR